MTERVVLVGNPNCGKTTLFNALTGSQQQVGNWPGVTVEKKSGCYVYAKRAFELTDLPGVYGLGLPEHVTAKDAYITAQVIATGDIDTILNVVDACHIERQLYLTSQLLELGKPMVVALNMMDLAQQQGITIDCEALSRQLNCPVVVLQAHRSIGLESLQQALITAHSSLPVTNALLERFPQHIKNYFAVLQQDLGTQYASSLLNYRIHRWMEQSDANGSLLKDLDIQVADARYQMIHEWVGAIQTKSTDAKERLTAKLDKILLHRILGLPLFFAVMYALFFLAIDIGGAVQSGFDVLSKSLFVTLPESLLATIHAPNWLIAITAHGLGQALNTMLTFIPVLAVMYFLLSFLESSGYMARAAFVMDRVMRSLGLPGQAFIPMIVGFGCNVPAILAARTMQTERDRLLTVLMNPYMSCSARLAIYAVFAAVFFPKHGALVIFSLYLVGIGMGVMTGYLVRHTLLPTRGTPLILELPAYHRPSFKRLRKETSFRLRYFFIRAGRVILPVCLGLSVLNLCSLGGQSILANLGQWVTPIFVPMGIHADNWPAVVSLLTGMLAKEVVIGTLNSLYLQLDHVNTLVTVAGTFDFISVCRQAIDAVYDKLCALFDSSLAIEPSSMSQMLQVHFATPVAAYAYLLFVLLYIPCASTMAAIRQETNRKWMWFSIAWSLLLAYSTAVMFYQIATWGTQSQHTVVYVLGGVMISLVVGIRRFSQSGGYHAVSTS